MPTIQEELTQLEETFNTTLAGTKTEEELSKIRAGTFGKDGTFSQILRRMSEVPSDSKREVGEQVNEVFRRMNSNFTDRALEFQGSPVIT